jgi:hypothetical protein
MSMNFQEILKELEYRSKTGIIDLTKEEQVTKLAKILKENGVSNSHQLAQKVRVYFSYLSEAGKKGDTGLEAAAEFFSGKRYKNNKGNEVAFTTAINYNDPSDSAHNAAMSDFESFLSANKGKYGDIEKAKQPGPEKPGTSVFGKDKGAKVFPSKDDAEKSKSKEKEKPEGKKLKRSEEQTKRQKLNDATLVNIVKSGLIPTKEKKLSGAGVFDPTEEQLTSALDFFQKRIENPDYELDLPRYEVTEEDIDRTIEVMRNELGPKEFSRVMGSIQKAGGVDPKLTTGEAGKQRARDIIRLYLSHGGRSAVTGKVVPFNQMQLDHRIPYSNAARDVEEKRKRGIKTTLLEEQDRLDSPENWDLMETSLNQLKNSLEGDKLVARINQKLSQSPEEKELRKLEQEVKNIREAKLLQNLVDSFGKGDFSGLNETSIEDMSGDEIDIVMKAWNYWHPNTSDANSFRKIDPKYDEKLKKRGIQVPPPNHPATIIRMVSQQGGSRSRGIQRPVPERKSVTINAMKKEKVLKSKRETITTDTVLLKAIKNVEKGIKDKVSKIGQLKQQVKQQKGKNK